jgi:hypothetical protein
MTADDTREALATIRSLATASAPWPKARKAIVQTVDAALAAARRDPEGVTGLDVAMVYLRTRLVGSPPNVDSEDVYFAGLLDEAEAVGRAAARRDPEPVASADAALCDHPCSARVLDSGGWSCRRCEQFCEPPCPACAALAADPEARASMDVEALELRRLFEALTGYHAGDAPATDVVDAADNLMERVIPESMKGRLLE